MQSERIIQIIQSFDTAHLKGELAEAPEPESGPSKAEIIEDTVDWIEALRADLTALVRQIGDGEDVEMALAIQYVELKSRWIAFNTKMNYSMFRGTTPRVQDMCRAAAVSSFLGHIEGLLKQDDIEHITEFLARPINEAA